MEKLILPTINFFLVVLAGYLGARPDKPADRYRWKNAEIAVFMLSAWASFLVIAWTVNHA